MRFFYGKLQMSVSSASAAAIRPSAFDGTHQSPSSVNIDRRTVLMVILYPARV